MQGARWLLWYVPVIYVVLVSVIYYVFLKERKIKKKIRKYFNKKQLFLELAISNRFQLLLIIISAKFSFKSRCGAILANFIFQKFSGPPPPSAQILESFLMVELSAGKLPCGRQPFAVE